MRPAAPFPQATAPVVYLDFDNTITIGDVLDSVIEHFAVDGEWAELEREWKAGQLSTRDCLDGQVRSLRMTWNDLRKFLRSVELDPAFPELLAFLRAEEIEHLIVSDSFGVIISEILSQHGIDGLPIVANELIIEGDRPSPSFPHGSLEHPGCAHCKRQQLLARPDQPSIYVGDGRSDLCPAVIADLVFAKDSLLKNLTARGIPSVPFTDLRSVLTNLQKEPLTDLRRLPLRRA